MICHVNLKDREILQSNSIFLILLIPIIRILILAIYFTLAPHNPYKEKYTTTPHMFLSLANNIPKTQLVLKSGVYFCTDDGKSNGDLTFYIPLYEGDNVIFVPVVSVDTVTFKSDLTKPIFLGKPIPNNDKDSQKAIEKAIIMFKSSELCVCDLKQMV